MKIFFSAGDVVVCVEVGVRGGGRNCGVDNFFLAGWENVCNFVGEIHKQ